MEYQQKNPLKYYAPLFYLSLLIRYTSELVGFPRKKAMSALFKLIIVLKKVYNLRMKRVKRDDFVLQSNDFIVR